MTHTEDIQEKILEELDLSKEVGDDELIEVIHRILRKQDELRHISLKERASLGKELFNSFRKFDILQELLEDDEISEIMVNGTDNIFIEKDGTLYELQRRFTERNKLEDIIQQIVAGANRMVNEASPIVDARLEDGSRVNIVLYPIAINGPIVTIRKFPKETMTMKELIAREALSEEVSQFLEKLMVARYNVFISGGTGSG